MVNGDVWWWFRKRLGYRSFTNPCWTTIFKIIILLMVLKSCQPVVCCLSHYLHFLTHPTCLIISEPSTVSPNRLITKFAWVNSVKLEACHWKVLVNTQRISRLVWYDSNICQVVGTLPETNSLPLKIGCLGDDPFLFGIRLILRGVW